MPLNTRLLQIEISRLAEPVLRKEAQGLAQLDFDVKKELLLEAFDAHPVTRELEAGPEGLSQNSSISTKTGGNLYSLLGFVDGQKPTAPLRRFLVKNIRIGKTRKGVNKGTTIVYDTPVTYPTIQEVDDTMAADGDASLEWTDRSFTDLISNGIPGLPAYLFSLVRGRFHTSRSGTAIQAKKPIRGGSVGRIPYVGQLLTLFSNLIKGRV